MGKFTKVLKVAPLRDEGLWVLLEEFPYEVKPGEVIKVPAGVITDFASIPKLLHWGRGPWGLHGPASVIHDWLYQSHSDETIHKYTRDQCDDIFLQALEDLGVKEHERNQMYSAVHELGEEAWNKHVSRYEIAIRPPINYDDRKIDLLGGRPEVFGISPALKMRKKYQADPHRPMYHFMAPENICHPFDPQGCIYWKGRYHLFYAYQENDVGLWGHSSSIDLLHWRQHPIALGVSRGDPETQVYAGGSILNKEGIPTMIYHGVNAGSCIATSEDDELIFWSKHPSNPVIPIPKKGDADYGKYHVWDTCGWVDGETYYSICGNRPFTPLAPPETDGDVAFLFKSPDLVNWEYVHPFYKSDRKWTDSDEDCYCPDFFPLGNKHVLMFISHTQGTQYYIGRYEGEKFDPEYHGRMNWPGGPSYAQESLVDGKGRRIFWAWVCESRSQKAQLESGWAGVMSLPKVLSLAEDGTLLIEPVEELSALHLNHRSHEDIELTSDSERVLEDVRGDCLELALEVEPPSDGEFSLKVRCSPYGEEQTVITFDPSAKKLKIDTNRSSLSKEVAQPWPKPSTIFTPNPLEGKEDVRVQEAPFSLSSGETLKLRVFLDRSILEVFANGRQCVTQRIYPTRSDSQGVILFSNGGSTKVKNLEAWDMAATNPW